MPSIAIAMRDPTPRALGSRDIGSLVELVAHGRLAEAESRAKALLGTNPRVGMLWKILGVALMRQGKDAEAALRRAAELMPQDGEAHGNLGLALHDQGRWAEALPSLDRALAAGPPDADILIAAANARRLLSLPHGLREAAALYARAISLDPSRAESHCGLGTVLFELRRIDEAADSFRRALALEPDHAPAHCSLAAALRQQGRPDEAEASCRAALAIVPDSVEALCLLAELLADRGRFAEAEELFRRAIANNPDYPNAWIGIGSLRRMTTDDAAWLTGAAALLGRPLSPRDEVGLHFAIGKYFDDVGEYDQAFSHYHRGNELHRRGSRPYDAGKLVRRVDAMIGLFGDGFPRLVPRGSSSARPIFVIGMPRSGTSLVEQILASHSKVFGAGELAFWDEAFLAYLKAGAHRSGAQTLPALAASYLERLTRLSGGAARVVDKMPANFLYAGLIHAALPEARIIHVRRHPLDTCVSIYFQNFFNVASYANDLDSLAHYHGQYVRITDHWRRVLPPSRFLEVAYEDLVAQPEAWIRRMLEFLDLPFESGCLEFHRTDRVVITASKWQVRQKIHSGSTGRWRHYEKHLGPLKGLL